MLTLLSMSVLTVVMLVTIVAAVADMDLRLPDAYVDIDPWTGMPPSLAEPSYRDQGPYAGLTSPVAPRDDSESRPDAPLADPF